MNPLIIKGAVDAFKNATELGGKVVEAGSSDKYAKGVNELNKEVSDTQAEIRNIIVNSNEFTDAEKIEKLKELAQEQAEVKKQGGEEIKENRENVGRVVSEVAKGVLTGGISLVAPKIVKGIKNSSAKKAALKASEAEVIEAEAEDVVEVEEA